MGGRDGGRRDRRHAAARPGTEHGDVVGGDPRHEPAPDAAPAEPAPSCLLPRVSCPGETGGASATDPYDANADVPTEGPETNRTAADIACKPAGVSLVDLPTPNGDPSHVYLLYWDGLEGEENIDFNIVAEYGDKAGNDQSRILQLNTADPRSPTWSTPAPSDGGAAADGQSQ